MCSDDNPCTQDVDPAAAECACLDDHPPVNCDDSNLCTVDTCDPEATDGCVYTPIVCTDDDLCTVDSCDPLTGGCVFPAVTCSAGEACNPDNGTCETSDPCAPNPCVNGGFCVPAGTDDADLLTPRRIYEVLPDESAANSDYLRIIDNEGEDYLYPAGYFVFMDFPPAIEQALREAS